MDDSGPAVEPDLAALRAEHPGLLTLQDWLRATGWKPQPQAGALLEETRETT